MEIPDSFDGYENCIVFNNVINDIMCKLGDIFKNFKPDVIITVQRKGHRFWEDIDFYEDVSVLDNVDIVSDSDFKELDYEGKNVLVVDDSMKEGKHISYILSHLQNFSDVSAKVFVVSTNDDAIAKIETTFNVCVYSVYVFRDYKAQSEKVGRMLSFFKGLGFKYSLGYRYLEFVLNGRHSEDLWGFFSRFVNKHYGKLEFEKINTCRCAKKARIVFKSVGDPKVNDLTDNKVFITIGESKNSTKILLEVLLNPIIKNSDTIEDINSCVSEIGNRFIGEVEVELSDWMRKEKLTFLKNPKSFIQYEHKSD